MLLALSLAGSLVIAVRQVPEPPVPDAIAWRAPRGCPDRDSLKRAIAQRLGRPLAPGELELDAQVSQHTEAPRYRLQLRLTIDRRDQVRTLTAERCPSLVDATALLVALAVAQTTPPATPDPSDPAYEIAPPDALDRPDPSPPAPASPDREPPAPASADLPPPPPAPDPSASVDLPPLAPAPPPSLDLPSPLSPLAPPATGPGGFVRLHGGPELGSVPGITGALGLAAGLLWRSARLEFQAVYLAPRTATRGDSSVRVFLLAGSVQGCARPGRRRLEFPLCGGIEVGGARARARGPGARATTSPWVAGIASAGATWHANSRVSLAIALQGLVRLAGPRFELRDPGPPVPLFEPAPVSGRLLFGLEVRLGDPR